MRSSSSKLTVPRKTLYVPTEPRPATSSRLYSSVSATQSTRKWVTICTLSADVIPASTSGRTTEVDARLHASQENVKRAVMLPKTSMIGNDWQ